MSELTAYALVGAFMALQLIPLVLAYRGKLSWWITFQVVFATTFFVFAHMQNDGRGAWILMAVTGLALAVTTTASIILALLGHYVRTRKAHTLEKG